VKKLIVAVFALCATGTLFAQNTRPKSPKEERRAEKRARIAAMVKQEEAGVLAYYKQSSFGVGLRTNGYTAFYELGRMKSPRFANLYTIELSEIKHDKEERYQNTESFFANSFIYGKLNSFFQLKLGFGQQYILGQKGNKNGVAVLAIYGAGLSAGLLKPYYLTVEQSVTHERLGDIRYQDDTSQFLNGIILGSSGFAKGLNEISVNPGAHAKAALRFDFGRFNESIQAIEIGISTDFYSKKVGLVARTDPKRLFVQGHIAFLFGRRR
jgi:hypothetical protein